MMQTHEALIGHNRKNFENLNEFPYFRQFEEKK